MPRTYPVSLAKIPIGRVEMVERLLEIVRRELRERVFWLSSWIDVIGTSWFLDKEVGSMRLLLSIEPQDVDTLRTKHADEVRGAAFKALRGGRAHAQRRRRQSQY